jgi:hypothetical protein
MINNNKELSKLGQMNSLESQKGLKMQSEIFSSPKYIEYALHRFLKMTRVVHQP